jgi:hypothetical protein
MAERGLRSDGQAPLRRGESYYTEKVFMGQTSEGIRQAFHYEFPGELELLKSLVPLCASIGFRKTPRVLIVNIGAGAGTSGLAFLETSLPPNQSEVILHTVDITAEPSPFGSLHSEQVVCEEAGFHLGVNWFQHHMDSKLLAKDWNGGLVDICFVDGAHSYGECFGDVIAWEPLIRKGGFMVIHDYNKQLILPDNGEFHSDGPHPVAWFGVNQVVDEYLKPKYEVLEQVKSTIVFRIS